MLELLRPRPEVLPFCQALGADGACADLPDWRSLDCSEVPPDCCLSRLWTPGGCCCEGGSCWVPLPLPGATVGMVWCEWAGACMLGLAGGATRGGWPEYACVAGSGTEGLLGDRLSSTLKPEEAPALGCPNW